jgi:excisionase family DNA binding protein
MTVSTVEAAQRLGVSRRQVQRLIAAGDLPAQRTAGDAWLVDALALNALNRARPSRGRPWTEETAWAALLWLSGLDAGWLGARTEARLRQRLRRLDASALAIACRRRATTHRYRTSDSFLVALRDAVALSGASVATAADFGLAADETGVDGYCDREMLDDLVARFHLTPDTRGNVTLRVADAPPAGLFDRAAMPAAVIALDLAESLEVRERSAGLRVLEDLLR